MTTVARDVSGTDASSWAPIRLDGAELTDQRHVCAMFRDEVEQYRLLLPFIADGLEGGARAFHIVDPGRRDAHLQRLQSAGIDVTHWMERGALEVRTWPDVHLIEGHFDQDRMLSLIQEVLRAGRPAFPLTRFIANMEWALEDVPGVGDIVEYEARLNDVLPKYGIDPVICTYDLGRFGAGVTVDILRTHPVAVVGGTLQENPFYVAPDVLRAELRDRDRVRVQ
jgi:hypothetical protein